MKQFFQLRETKIKAHPKGEHVSSKRVGKAELMIHKEKGVFTVYIDREKLDSYKTQKEAEKMGLAFIKQYKAK
tara:strand:- start:1703 stop:1921 length:219 start_codon:yes stop_codon:yes gene_type:complete